MNQLDELFETMKSVLMQITMLESDSVNNANWSRLMEMQAEIMTLVKELRSAQNPDRKPISYKEMYNALKRVPFREGYAYDSDIPKQYMEEYREAMTGHTTNRLGAVYWENFSYWLRKVKMLADKE